jgi:hypothetical protein
MPGEPLEALAAGPAWHQVKHDHAGEQQAERTRVGHHQHLRAEHRAEQDVGHEWPVGTEAFPPATAVQDARDVDRDGRQQCQQDRAVHVGDQRQQRRGDHREAEAERAVHQAGQEHDRTGQEQQRDGQGGEFGHRRLGQDLPGA